MKYFFTIVILFEILFSSNAIGQDIDRALKDAKNFKAKSLIPKNSLSITGGLSAQQIFYRSWGIENRQFPFNYNYSGNLNVSVLGKINIPVSFNFINQNATFNQGFGDAFSDIWNRRQRFAQPFNRFSFRPTYKGITLHLGTCALNYSPYSVANHRFDGAAVEYKSENQPIYGSVMWGNLLRAVPIDSLRQGINNSPSYRRTGMGMKIGFKHQKDKIEFVLFSANDIYTPWSNLDQLRVNPQSNAVFSAQGAKLIAKNFYVNAEYSVSGISTDQRAADASQRTFWKSFGGLLATNSSTIYKNAYKLGVDYQAKTLKTGIEYSRVDPEYRTFGGYFFNNDLETISAKFSTQLYHGKLSLLGNAGLQQNNLDRQKLQTTKRWVSAVNATFQPTETTNLLVTFSNFSNYSNLQSNFLYLTRVTPYNFLDTLDYQQINRSFSATFNKVLPSSDPKNITKAMNIDLIWQGNQSQQGNQQQNTKLVNVSAGYSYASKPKKTNVSINVSYSQSEIGLVSDTFLGPSSSFSKTWGDFKLQSYVALSVAKTKQIGFVEAVSLTNVVNGRLRMSYTIAKKHNLDLTTVFLKRAEPASDRLQRNFSELTATIGYSLQFTALDIKKK